MKKKSKTKKKTRVKKSRKSKEEYKREALTLAKKLDLVLKKC